MCTSIFVRSYFSGCMRLYFVDNGVMVGLCVYREFVMGNSSIGM